MSDARERDLERAGLGGDEAALLRLLRARVRSGALSQEALELLAHLGHPAAHTLSPRQPPAALRPWLADLHAFPTLGHAAAARAALACAQAVRPQLQLAPPAAAQAAAAFTLLEAWSQAPTPERAQEIASRGPALRRIAYGAPESNEGVHQGREGFSTAASIHAARALFDPIHLIGYQGLHPPGGEPANGRQALRALRYAGLEEEDASQRLRAAARAALEAWLLDC